MDFLEEHEGKLHRGKTLELRVGLFHEEMVVVYTKEKRSEITR